MRLRTYTASNMAGAVLQIRAELGSEAIIVSSRKGPGGEGVIVTAAMDPAAMGLGAEADASELAALDALAAREEAQGDDIGGTLRQCLTSHGIPAPLAERLIRAAEENTRGGPMEALAAALSREFAFVALDTARPVRPLMLVGPPGAGKTVGVAKLAAAARIEKRPAAVITTDTKRAGAIEQLAAFTRILGIDLQTAGDPAALRDAVTAAPPGSLVLIDTAAVNPYRDDELARLAEMMIAAGAESALVLAAGGDPLETCEIAGLFANAGAGRLIVTRLDMARHVGGILAAADGGRLAFSAVSVSPQVADPLKPMGSSSLARLIVPDGLAIPNTRNITKAAS